MKLYEVQQKLKAPKGQFNSFGKYKYRSCEDILEAIKPLLVDSTLTLTDDIVQIGARYYVKATATFLNGEETRSSVAYAREPETKKGMDESQITGTASSYARKYALNGLFCIDDTKDADTDEHAKQQTGKKEEEPQPVVLNDKQKEFVGKVALVLEENMDGAKIDEARLTEVMISNSQKTKKPIPNSTAKDNAKVSQIAMWLMGKTEVMAYLKGEAA